MTKATIAVGVCFLLAFAAGGAAGLLLGRSARPAPGSWLTRELGLTPDQQEKMRKIWSESMPPPRPEQREAWEKERDQRIRAMLTAEQQAQYDELMRERAARLAALAEARKKAFEDAVEQTKAILTEPQRKKYEEILKRQADFHRRRYEGAEGSGAPAPKAPQRSSGR